MTWATDDLAQVLIAPEREFAGFAQGILREWDGNTFSNVVEVRGGTLTNLPVASGVEALTYQAGDVLMLSRWKLRSGRGIATYWIGQGGRVIIPGTGAAEKAVAWMRGELARQISREVFGEAIHAQGENVVSVVDSLSWDDPSTGPAGPEITGVEIGSTGRCLVFISVQFRNLFIDVDGSGEIQMSVEVSGATSRAAGAEGVLSQGRSFGSANFEPSGGIGRAFLVDGLTPGSHTFATKFQLTDDATQASVVFPELIVIPF